MAHPVSEPTAVVSGSFSLGGDLTVNRLGYGTMRLVGEGAWGEPPDREAARNVLRRAVELGITLIDTADAYGPGIAEELIAEALHPYPANVVIATKGGLTRQGPAKSKPCGKIRHIGLSEVTPEQIEEAQKIVPIVSVQNRYNLAERKSDPTLHFCEQHRIAFLPWYPMNAGKIAKGSEPHTDGTNQPVAEFAAKYNATVSQIALAWLLQHSPVLLPIPGTSSIAHLEENIAAAAPQIPEEEWDALELIVDTQAS